MDTVFTVKSALKKRREHGLESWVLFLDLVKVFDRVPRDAPWKVLAKFGVPEKLIRLLKALHVNFIVKITISEIIHYIDSIVGVKQGMFWNPYCLRSILLP